ncbi:transcription factor TFIIIB component B''-like isoform X2 [Vicia villosa]|uniref:transcription factor TFIIIB component B''-like isoform X2 n=1 Tax=Vicia villosa TaxID=3911 RepID=UPI00273B226F|nr:transcription factor TFIIIB component B''-like isoform X2 [Vicia villosa]
MENLFDDIAPGPTTRARSSARFAPKAKPKQPPRKNVSASKDENNVHVASSTTLKESEGVSQNESHNAVTVSSSIEEPNKSGLHPDIHENEMNNVAAPSTVSSTIVRVEEQPKNGEGSFLSTDKSLQVLDNSGDGNTAIPESNIHSNFEFGKVLSAEIELDPFSNVLPDPGTGNARKFQPKVKPRPRVSNTPAIASTSSGELPPCTSFVLPAYDGKSRPESQEGADLNPDCQMHNVYYQSMNSGTDPPSGISIHEGLTNSAGSPTLADFLQQDVTGEKEDANETIKSSKKHKRSSTTGVEDKGAKTSRQTRKRAARKPAKSSLITAIEDDDLLHPPYDFAEDELEENNDEDEVVCSPKKKKASTNSKKSVAKNGKTSGKRKKANGDIEKATEESPKKFPHSSRRRRRCVDKALLDDEFLDQRTLPIRDIILLAEYKERLAKKEAATSKTSSTNQSDGDFRHEVDVNNAEEFFGSDDEFRDPDDDDQVSERFTSTAPLLNYQSFMDKTPRGKWSKQDTEVFYEAVRQFGTDFSMIQQLFPDKTRHQVKLKYKKEERQHPLLLSDAVNNRSKDLSFFKLVVERQQQNSNKEEQETAEDASDLMLEEEAEDPTPETNEEVATTKQEQEHIDVRNQEDSTAYPIPEQSDDSEDDLLKWSQYQSAI